MREEKVRDAIIRLIDVEGEPLRITILEQPVREGGYHSLQISDRNLASMLSDMADAAARRLVKG